MDPVIGAHPLGDPVAVLAEGGVMAVAIRDRKLGIWLRVWRDALRGLPRVLRKRRDVQARRRVSLAQLEAVVGPDGGTS